MAKDIQSIERTIAAPTSTVDAGNSFSRLGDSSSALATMVSGKLNEAGIDLAAQQGQKDALDGKAPKSLAPGVNKTTRAYNAAVSDTEARHQILSANQQINQAYAEATNPATFTSETPALFKAKVQGIVDGTLENTRDSTRAQVALSLEHISANASINMLNHSIKFDNQQTLKTMANEVDMMIKERRTASIEGDEKRVSAIDAGLNKTLEDYGNMNAEIKRSLPEYKKKLQENAEVDKVLSGFAHSASEGKQAQFLSDLSHNKDNLPFEVWDKATKEVLALDATEQKLNHEARAISFQSVVNGIDNNTITSAEQFANDPNLTAVDQLKLIDKLQLHQQALAKSQYNLVEAQKNIANGNPGFNSANQKNAMFTNTRHEFEQLTGRPMTLVDMWQSVNGEGPLPASGIPGVSMGANVPQFDAVLSNQLTSRDPTQVIQAASIFKDAVNVKKQPNLINLSGEALSIASNFNTLNLGNVDPIELAKQVSKTTLDAKDPEIQTRSNRFTELYGGKFGPQKLRSVFKQVFDTEYKPGVSDNAYGVFKETYREQFLLSDSDEASLTATKYLMRQWCTSKYFEDGMVGQPCPEKELTIANVGYAFDNQLAFKTQNVINNNKLAREKDATHPFKIEWANPKKEIDVNSVSDSDRVFKRLGIDEKSTTLSELIPSPSKPKVKINGRETELFLMPTPESRLGESVQYALFYHDKFGMVQPVPDAESPNGMAMFSPAGLEQWAPLVLEDENKQRVKDEAIKYQKTQALKEWDALQPSGVLGMLLKANFPEATRMLSGTAEQRADIFRRLRSGDAKEIEGVIRQRIQGTESASAVTAEAGKADHVGIQATQSSSNATTDSLTGDSNIVDSVFKLFSETEGEGSKVRGDVKTGSYGLTQAALTDMGDKRKLSDIPKPEQKELAKKFLGLKLNELNKKLDNFSSAPKEIKTAILDAVYNEGASRAISQLKRFAKDENWLGGMREMLKVSTQDGKTLLGLGKRRAQEYNEVAALEDQPLIKFVEQTKNTLNFIDSDGNTIFALKGTRHPDSEIHKIPVPKLGAK